MRGFPPLQIFLLALAFGLLAIPLVQLTGSSANVPSLGSTVSEPSAAKAETVPTLIRLRYAHKPTSISLKQAGRELLGAVNLLESPSETQVQMLISKAGDDLELTASWAEGTPETALTLEIEPDGHELRSQTCWSNGTAVNEILTFIW
jgi:hypothetical protein